jgi:small subunit ribosomal protein S20
VANTRSARKRIRQNEKRRLRNRAVRSAVRSTVKSAREALGGKASEAASSERARLVREAIRALDRAVTQGIVHRNTAARRKSALARKLNAPA